MKSATHGRIALLEREQVSAEVAKLYDLLLEQRGVVPNMFRTLAHTPALALGVAGFLKPLMGDGAIPGWYKELVATRVCILQDFEYGIVAHTASARQKGATQAQVDGLHNFERGPYNENEKLGFRAADRLHRSPSELDDDFYAALKRVYSDPQIIELVVTAAAFEFFARLVDGLRIPVTPLPAPLAHK